AGSIRSEYKRGVRTIPTVSLGTFNISAFPQPTARISAMGDFYEARYNPFREATPTRTREPTRERNPERHPAYYTPAVDPRSAGREPGRGGRFLVLADFPGRAASVVTDDDEDHERRDRRCGRLRRRDQQLCIGCRSRN